MRNLLESSKRNAGWLRRKLDNKFKESIEQLENSDRKPMKPKAPSKQRRQQNAGKP
jgi:hypothetical protein